MALIDIWGAPLDENGAVDDGILGLEELRAVRESGVVFPGRASVLLPPDTVLDTIAPWLAAIHLICVEFPKFRDGRGFTLARVLRERYHFAGDIRAVGHLLPDQLAALRHCGFSSVLTPADHPPEQWAPSTSAHDGMQPPSAQLLNRLMARRTP